MIPNISINGTGRADLYYQRAKVVDALRSVIEALYEMYPLPRDYQEEGGEERRLKDIQELESKVDLYSKDLRHFETEMVYLR